MASGPRGSFISITRLDPWGVTVLFLGFVTLMVFIGFNEPIMYEPSERLPEMAFIIVGGCVWAYYYFRKLRPSVIRFYENGFSCSGLRPADPEEARELKGKVLPRFYFYDEVEYAFMRIDEEEDEGEVEQKLNGRFVFRVKGRRYDYKAWGVDLEELDETLIDTLDDKYLGALVHKAGE